MRHIRDFLGRRLRKRAPSSGGEAAEANVRTCTGLDRGWADVPQLQARSEGPGADPRAGKLS